MKYIVLSILVIFFLGCSDKDVTGKSIYNNQCASCHGQMARKSALGRSAIISGFSEKELVQILIGYQNGTYGGPMKSTMVKEVSSLNNEKIQRVAKYIAELH